MFIDIVFVVVVIGLLVAIYKLKFQPEAKTSQVQPQATHNDKKQEINQRPAQARWTQQMDEDNDQSDQQNETSQSKMDIRKQMKKQQKQKQKKQRKQALEHHLQNQRKKRQKQEEEEQEKEREEQQKRQKQQQYYKKLIEEEQKRKKAEYDQWKNAFQVQETGNIKQTAQEQQRKRIQFMNSLQKILKKNKLSLLEDLSHRYKLTTKQIIEKIKQLEATEKISGIFDERGKYLFIEKNQWQAIQNYIQARGRVKKLDIIEQCSRVIKIPDEIEENQGLKQLIDKEVQVQ